jgi:hypothetical protein
MKDVLEKLRDDAEYYGGVGKNYLSNSDIQSLLGNVKEFRVPRADNPVFAKGRLFHQLILEPEKASEVVSLDIGSRNTKAYKDFVADNELEFCLLDKEVKDIKSWVSSMMSNMDFFDMITEEGNRYEIPSIREIKGVMWKGKADIIGNECLIDLKTTGDIKKFKRSASLYNYDSQAYIYQELFGKPLIFLVIDKTTHQLGIFRPSEDFIKRGERKVEKAVEVYNNFFSDSADKSIDDFYIEEYID